MNLSRRRRRGPQIGRWTERGVLVTCGVAAGAIATRLEHRRRHPRQRREYDDATLARKVESEIFRPARVPNGRINVNACDGIVELRGAVDRRMARRLGRAARRVDGVRGVHNLLHAPGTPAPHAPPSDPAEVKARAEAAHGGRG